MTRPEHISTAADPIHRRIYWHRELPPFEAEIIGEHMLEATSSRVPISLARYGHLWDRAYHELMENAQTRMTQEVDRLGGRYAHVLDESIDSRRNEATDEAWLHGLFAYTLYR